MRPLVARRSSLVVVALLTSAGCSAGPTTRVCAGPMVVRDAVDVAAAKGCTVVDGDLTIEGTPLATLHGLESLREVRGTLSIGGNPALVSLDGLDALVTARDVVIAGNPRLESLTALHHLARAGGITLADLPALTSASGLESLRAVAGLFVTNTALADLVGFSGLRSIGDLVVVGNPRLGSLAGLDRVTDIDRIDVEHNPRLASTASIEEAARSVRWSYVDATSWVAHR